MAKRTAGLIMGTQETSTINWEIPLPLELSSGCEEPPRVSRQELQHITQVTTDLCVGGIVSGFGLDQSVEAAMFARLAHYDVELTTGGPEYAKEKIPVGSAVNSLGNVALLPFVKPESVQVPESAIFLSVKGIAEEQANLTRALQTVLPVVAENPQMLNSNDYDALKSLQDPANLLKTAASLSFARRLLKYGLLPDDVMPKTMRAKFGLDDWLDHCHDVRNEKLGQELEFNNSDKKLLRSAYKKDNLAIKNLRFSVWKSPFYKIVGIQPEPNPFFYDGYAKAVAKNDEHSITFNYDGESCQINKAEVKSSLEQIFVPNTKKLKLA